MVESPAAIRNEWGGARQLISNCVRTIHIPGGLRKWRIQLIFTELGLWKPRDPHHTIPGIKIQISSDHLPLLAANYGSPMNRQVQMSVEMNILTANHSPGVVSHQRFTAEESGTYWMERVGRFRLQRNPGGYLVMKSAR